MRRVLRFLRQKYSNVFPSPRVSQDINKLSIAQEWERVKSEYVLNSKSAPLIAFKSRLIQEWFKQCTDCDDKAYKPATIKEIVKYQQASDQLPLARLIHRSFCNDQLTELSSAERQEFEDCLAPYFSFPFRCVDFLRTKIVKQGEFELLTNCSSEYDSLVTSPLKPCCALLAQCEQNQKTGLYHIDHGVGLSDLIAFCDAICDGKRDVEFRLQLIMYPSPVSETNRLRDRKILELYHIADLQDIYRILTKVLGDDIKLLFPKLAFISSSIRELPTNNKTIPVKVLMPWMDRLSYFGMLTNFVVYRKDHESRFLDHEQPHQSCQTLQSLLDMARYSFGVDRSGSFFQTEYVTSLRWNSITLWKNVDNFIHIPYHAYTHLVIPCSGPSIYKSASK